MKSYADSAPRTCFWSKFTVRNGKKKQKTKKQNHGVNFLQKDSEKQLTMLIISHSVMNFKIDDKTKHKEQVREDRVLSSFLSHALRVSTQKKMKDTKC